MGIEQVEVGGQIHKVERPEGMSDEQFSQYLTSEVVPAIESSMGAQQPPIESATQEPRGMSALGSVGVPPQYTFPEEQQILERERQAQLQQAARESLGPLGAEAATFGAGVGATLLPESLGGQMFKEAETQLGGSPVTAAAGEAGAFGLGTGTGIVGLANIPRFANFMQRGGKIRQTVGKLLKEAKTSPAAFIGAEGAIGGLSGAAQEGTTEATGSEWAGLVAGLGTGILTGIPAARVFELRSDKFVDQVLADRFRKNPELLRQTEANIAEANKMGLDVRLQLLSEDPEMRAVAEKLGRLDANMADTFTQGTQNYQTAANQIFDEVTNGALSPEMASVNINRIGSQLENQMMDAVEQLHVRAAGDETAGEIGEQMFGRFKDVHEAVLAETNKLYDNAGKSIPIPAANIRSTLTSRIAEALSKTARTKAVLPQVVKDRANDIMMELEGDTSVAALNEIRGLVLENIRAARVAGEGATVRRLSELEKGLTESLESVDDDSLKLANQAYRKMKEVFANTRIGTFFSKDAIGEFRKSPENFASEFLLSDPMASSKELRTFVDKFGDRFGVSQTDIQDMARRGFYAMIRAKGGAEITPASVASFVNGNKTSLRAYGLLDEFSDFKGMVDKVKSLQTSRGELDKLAIAQFGYSANPAALRRAVSNGSIYREMANLPKDLREPVRRTALKAAMTDDAGNLINPKQLTKFVSSTGNKLITDKATKLKLTFIASQLNRATAKAGGIRELSTYLKPNDIPVLEKLYDIALERITRPALKALRGGRMLATVKGQETVRKELVEALTTPEGANKIVSLAKREPRSWAVLATILYGRPAAYTQGGEE